MSIYEEERSSNEDPPNSQENIDVKSVAKDKVLYFFLTQRRSIQIYILYEKIFGIAAHTSDGEQFKEQYAKVEHYFRLIELCYKGYSVKQLRFVYYLSKCLESIDSNGMIRDELSKSISQKLFHNLKIYIEKQKPKEACNLESFVKSFK